MIDGTLCMCVSVSLVTSSLFMEENTEILPKGSGPA